MYSPGGSGDGAMPASVLTFWSKVLAERVQSFNSGGLGAQPPYETAGAPVRVAEEVSRLIRESGNVRSLFWFSHFFDADRRRARFCSVFTILADVRCRWDCRGESCRLRTGSRRVMAGRLLDLQYYSSGAVYTVLTFYQMWPVKVDNQDATLVWRIDMISAEQLGELRGVERLGSGAAMMREIQKAVKAFLRDGSRG